MGKDKIVNKMNIKVIDLKNKLIEPSIFMRKVLKDLLNLEFKAIDNIKYNAIFWKLNEDLKTYSPIYLIGNESDKYDMILKTDVEIVFTSDLKIDYIQNFIVLKNRFIPNRSSTPQKILIEYLKNILFKEHSKSWSLFGPKSFIYNDERDKIVVYIREDAFHMIHDGENVIDNFNIEHYNFSPKDVIEEDLDYFLQKILSHF